MEKRTHNRYEIWFPVTLEWGAKEVWAVVRDAGPGGILVASNARLSIGSQVTVRFRVTPQDALERRVRGKVVRTEHNNDPAGRVWPHRLAIAFARPMPELDEVFRRNSGHIRPSMRVGI
jgi:hypothetical protein